CFCLFPADGKSAGDCLCCLVRDSIIAQSTRPTKELHACHLLCTLPTSHRDQTYFSSALGVSATAWRPVVIVDLNDPNALSDKALFPQRQSCSFFRGDFMNANLSIVEDDTIGQVLSANDGLLNLIGMGFKR